MNKLIEDYLHSTNQLSNYPEGININKYEYDYWDVTELMERYADYCVKLALELASNNAIIDINYNQHYDTFDYAINKQSILKIKLPEHK